MSDFTSSEHGTECTVRVRVCVRASKLCMYIQHMDSR